MISPKYPNLQKKTPGTLAHAQSWSLENIRDGLKYFFELNGRYPTATEFDEFGFLPSARLTQRNFGGMVKLRQLLGLEGPASFTSGPNRSQLAKDGDARAKQYEETFYNFLITIIPEVCVHERKVVRPGNIECDFFIYAGEKRLVIDLFYAKSFSSLQNGVIIKTKHHEILKYPCYFVLVGNPKISQGIIDGMLDHKKIKAPSTIHVMTEDIFKNYLESIFREIRTSTSCTPLSLPERDRR